MGGLDDAVNAQLIALTIAFELALTRTTAAGNLSYQLVSATIGQSSMPTDRKQLAELVKVHREYQDLSQEELAAKCGVPTNRSAIAHLEQGLRIPKPDLLTAICRFLNIPPVFWEAFTNKDSLERLEFEELLADLSGKAVSLNHLDEESRAAAEKQVQRLLTEALSDGSTYDLFNSVLVFYGLRAVSRDFFSNYLSSNVFTSLETLRKKITKYQHDAVQLFSTLNEAYVVLNSVSDIQSVLAPLKKRAIKPFTERTTWEVIEQIPDERLPDLGYISAAQVKKETAERQALKTFLEDLAKTLRDEKRLDLEKINEKTKRRMDSLLRKFNSSLPHGLFSPLFAPDPDLLERESLRVAPKSNIEITRMSETQRIGQRNLAHCLSADYMDVYVATSMRTDADFVSVNKFVRALFEHEEIRRLKLRYFNPTQSWIDDRIAKGLVEALMLRRAAVTIYMAQKGDTFGKDSEASVALGQGRSVIVYVPKLTVEGLKDIQDLFRQDRAQLIAELQSEDKSLADDIDDSTDEEALVSRVLTARLQSASQEQITLAIREHWADFDLYSEAERVPSNDRAAYRIWLDKVIHEGIDKPLTQRLRSQLISVLVATAVRFERRAKLFREEHPLALQIILSSGVLNGILVVRSVNQCAAVLNALLENRLSLELVKDDNNYKLIEVETNSTMRVISRHTLLHNAFEAQYERERRQQHVTLNQDET